MWDGAFAPRVRKVTSGCTHGSVYIDIGDPEFGSVTVRVQFDHTCAGGSTPPSNNKVYTFEIELDEFTDGQNTAAEDMRAEVENMTDSEKLAWVSNNLVWDQGIDTVLPTVLQ
jgi:hypothetical protein